MFTAFSRRVALALVASSLISLPAVAKNPGSLADAKVLAEQAIGHVKKVGYDQAVKDFNTDQAAWGIASRDKIVYVVVYGLDGTVVSHSVTGTLVGRNLIDLKDQGGREVIKDAVAVAKKGGGTINWNWANPVTKKMGRAEGQIQRIPGQEAFVWAVAFTE